MMQLHILLTTQPSKLNALTFLRLNSTNSLSRYDSTFSNPAITAGPLLLPKLQSYMSCLWLSCIVTCLQVS